MLLNYFLKFLSLFSNYNSPFPFKIALWGGDETGYIYIHICMYVWSRAADVGNLESGRNLTEGSGRDCLPGTHPL